VHSFALEVKRQNTRFWECWEYALPGEMPAGREGYTGDGEVCRTVTEAWGENDWCQQGEACIVQCQNCVPSCRVRQY